MLEPRTLFVDRDGDTLSCIPRDPRNPESDPVITIGHQMGYLQENRSIVFTEDEAREFIAEMAQVLLDETWGPVDTLKEA